MKTFKDLDFKPHSIDDGVQAVMNFDNNYGVSVIQFSGSYGFYQDLWEVAILYHGSLTYNTYITDDVLGYLTTKGVTKVMKQVQELED